MNQLKLQEDRSMSSSLIKKPFSLTSRNQRNIILQQCLHWLMRGKHSKLSIISMKIHRILFSSRWSNRLHNKRIHQNFLMPSSIIHHTYKLTTSTLLHSHLHILWPKLTQNLTQILINYSKALTKYFFLFILIRGSL